MNPGDYVFSIFTVKRRFRRRHTGERGDRRVNLAWPRSSRQFHVPSSSLAGRGQSYLRNCNGLFALAYKVLARPVPSFTVSMSSILILGASSGSQATSPSCWKWAPRSKAWSLTANDSYLVESRALVESLSQGKSICVDAGVCKPRLQVVQEYCMTTLSKSA